MADLGNLYFNVLLRDKTDEEKEKIRKNLVDYLSARIDININKESIDKSIRDSISGKKFKIDVEVSKASANAAMKEAFNKYKGMNTTPSDVRSARIAAIESEQLNRNTLALAKNRAEIAKAEKAELSLAMARDKASQSIAKQIRANENLNSSFSGQTGLVGQLKNQVNGYLSIYAAERFLRSIVQVGGEFEKQHIALRSIIGDAAKADDIFSQIKGLAVESPFQFKELATYTKQLAAFSIPSEELYDTTKRLADISAGLGVGMDRLILAFGQVRSAAFLRGQELRQFTEAGIPLVDELAMKFTQLEGRVVSAGEVIDKISKKEVSFSMVKDILWGMTGEGGQFYNMQAELAESLAGKASNLADAWDIMLSEIAEGNNGELKTALELLTKLMENWEAIGIVLGTAAAAFVGYKAAMLVMNSIKVRSIILEVGWANALRASTIAATKNAVAIGAMNKGTASLLGSLSKVKKALAVTFSNPWAIAIASAAAIGYYLYNAYQNANKLNNELNKTQTSELSKASDLAASYDVLVGKLSETTLGTKEYSDVISEINTKYGEYLDHQFESTSALDEVKKATDGVTESIYNRAKAQAYEKGITQIKEQYSEDIESNKNYLIKALSRNGVEEPKAMAIAAKIEFEISKDPDKDPVVIMENAANSMGVNFNKINGMAKLYARNMGAYLSKVYNEINKFGEALESSFSGITTPGQVEDIFKIIEDNQEKALKNLLTSDEDYEQKSLEIKLNGLRLKKEALEQYGQEQSKIYKKLLQDEELLLHPIDEWKTSLKKIIGENSSLDAKLNTSVDMGEFMNDFRENYKNAKEEIKRYEPILTKWKIDPEIENHPVAFYSQPAFIQNAIKGRNKAQKTISESERFSSITGIPLTDPNKKSKDQKDKYVEGLKKEVDLIKQAIKEYEELSKITGKESALEIMLKNPTYKNINKKYFDEDGLLLLLEDYLKKVVNRNTEAAKSVKDTWNKELGAAEFDIVKKNQGENLDAMLKDFDDYLSKSSKKWDLYKSLMNITGNKQQSASLAFGIDADYMNSFIDYPDYLKQQIFDQTGRTYDELSNLTETELNKLLGKGDDFASKIYKIIQDIEEGSTSSTRAILEDAVRMVEKYKTIPEKIKTIENKRDENIAKINENGGMSPEQKDAAKKAYIKEANEEIQKLNSEAFELSPLWQKLFVETTNIGYSNLNKMVKKAKDLIDNAKPIYDEDGKVKQYELPTGEGDKSYFISIEQLNRLLKKTYELENKINSSNPFKGMLDALKKYYKARKEEKEGKKGKEGDDEKKDALSQLGSSASLAAQMITGVTDAWGDMFSSLGNEDLADTIGLVGDLTSELGSLAEGIFSGDPVKAVTSALSFVPNVISSIAAHHDKKLSRAIEKNELEVKRLGNAYKNLQTIMERALGGLVEGQAQDMINNLENQKRLIEENIALEEDKKKSDPAKIEDYKQQIAELNDQIKYFYEDLAKELYGVDLKGWAKQLTDSLVSPWRNGESAAESFKKTTSDILSGVANEALRLSIIEPALQGLRDKIAPMMRNGSLSSSEIGEIAKELLEIEDRYSQGINFLEDLNRLIEARTGGKISLKDALSKPSLSGSVKGITEDTSELLASYINAIRNDVAMKREYLRRIVDENFPAMSNSLALHLAQLKKIETNTLRAAISTESIESKLNSVINGTSYIHIR